MIYYATVIEFINTKHENVVHCIMTKLIGTNNYHINKY